MFGSMLGGRADAERMARGLSVAIRKALLEEMQPGGAIYNFTARRR
ncbi:hypothetical protein LXT21_36395 [Myxococcus sp. K38C18041901]|nr:hypothetical protein [Myxococcus guangdongensis]MCP3064266.1 hypothetical protein [Myxococcus guangdongensis]